MSEKTEQQNTAQRQKISPFAWIPTLYFAEGVPNVLAVTVSIIMFKQMGMGNEEALMWSASLGWPWVLKPLWSPFLDMFGKKRTWIFSMEILIAVYLFCIGIFCSMSPVSIPYIIVFFFLIAFSSATHDIAADGYYIIALSEHDQALYSGLRNAFYRAAVLCMQGGLVWLVGILTGAAVKGKSLPVLSGYFTEVNMLLKPEFAWTVSILCAAILFAGIGLYHFFLLPKIHSDRPGNIEKSPDGFFEVILSFFNKKYVITAILFLLLFRFAEAQLRVAVPFLIDERSTGGLELRLQDQALLYGTFGMIALIGGGIVGGYFVSRFGFGKCFWPMVLAINIPDLVYVYLSFAMPENLWVIGSCVFIEQFGYGLGYTAFTLFMVYYAGESGAFKTSHFALMTGIAFIGILIPGMLCGYIMENIVSWLDSFSRILDVSGFAHGKFQIFFIWVILCTIPSFVVSYFAYKVIDKNFGRSRKSAE